jgi:platelet-activating factor acetylhydrolase IB subunit beta/gamma
MIKKNSLKSAINYSLKLLLILGAYFSLQAQSFCFEYPYQPYNEGRLCPQQKGWPLNAGAEEYTLKPEFDRRPGKEANLHKPELWPLIPTAGFWGGRSWLETHAKLVKTVTDNKGPIDILLLGDSITQQWGSTLDKPGTNPFNDPWNKVFGNYKTVNTGIGGDKIQNILWRFDHGGVEGLKPKVVILLAGNNNMFFTPETGIEPVAQGIITSVYRIKEEFPAAHIIVVKIFPAGDPSARFYQDIVKTNIAIDKLNLEQNESVSVLDIWNEMVNSNGEVKEELFTVDKIHLSLDGYELYASKLKPIILKALGVKK